MKLSKKILLLISLLLLFNTIDGQVIDTLKNDTITEFKYALPDSVYEQKTEEKKDKIEEPIKFSANDSMHISVNEKKIILYGKGELVTEGINLDADSIGININKKELEAKGIADSSGKTMGKPTFSIEDQTYHVDKLRYNFNSKKGLVYNAMTQEQDGFLHGEIVKMQNNDEMHIKQGKYTTCNLPHPHYYIDLTKAKLIKNKRIITGPIYFVIQDIPLPIWAPFALFPLSKKNSSGLHLPTYADEVDRGFGLIGTGYYFAINDYIDLDLTADIYSKGSWGINIKSNIKKRYAFTSSININYFHYQNGEKILATTKISNSYKIQASYNQAPKANPNSHFSANINFVNGNIQQYNAKDIEQFVTTSTSSSISYQKTFQGTPFRLTMNTNLSQNLSDSTSNLKFPNITFSMNKIFPFKPQNKPAKGRWYEKIGVQFNSSIQNSINAHDTILLKHPDLALRMMKSGAKYDIPIQTNFTVLKYFNISPSFNFHGRVYPYKIIKEKFDIADTTFYLQDTVWGINHIFDYDFRTSLSTRIYGTFNLNIGGLKAIRHTLSPAISYVYRPDFSQEKWGYYYENPQDTTQLYSPYSGGIYGYPGKGEQQLINFSLRNNFEAKVRAQKDSTQDYKKVKLIDNLSLSESYNFALDSMNLSNLGVNASMSPIKNTRISFNASFDPYVINSKGKKINKFEFIENKKIARLTSSTITLSTRFNSKEIKKLLFDDEKDEGVKWNANINYSFRFNKTYNINEQDFDINLNQNASLVLSIIPTQLWNVSVRTGYDFNAGKLTSTTFKFYRDLHCWEMSLQVTPFGRMKSYMFQINIKSSMFSALKYKRERSWHDNGL